MEREPRTSANRRRLEQRAPVLAASGSTRRPQADERGADRAEPVPSNPEPGYFGRRLIGRRRRSLPDGRAGRALPRPAPGCSCPWLQTCGRCIARQPASLGWSRRSKRRLSALAPAACAVRRRWHARAAGHLRKRRARVLCKQRQPVRRTPASSAGHRPLQADTRVRSIDDSELLTRCRLLTSAGCLRRLAAWKPPDSRWTRLTRSDRLMPVRLDEFRSSP